MRTAYLDLEQRLLREIDILKLKIKEKDEQLSIMREALEPFSKLPVIDTESDQDEYTILKHWIWKAKDAIRYK